MWCTERVLFFAPEVPTGCTENVKKTEVLVQTPAPQNQNLSTFLAQKTFREPGNY